MRKNILVTGGAGFIGSNLIDKLLLLGYSVACLDNFNDYYDPFFKRQNVQNHLSNPSYTLIEGDIRDQGIVLKVFDDWKPEVVIHLAARAGVRPSLNQLELYQTTNIGGTINLLEAAKKCRINKFIFGSSSSVYGINDKVPFSETDTTLRPVSPYAATKIGGEALCHTYAHLYDFDVITLRFFTVYGPRQRPDLAIRKFVERIRNGDEIIVYGDGFTARDYTYVDDIVTGILTAIDFAGNKYEIFNLGNSTPIKLNDLILNIEKVLGIKAKIKWTGDQPGDVPITYADISRAREKLNYCPTTTLEDGLKKFVRWSEEKTIYAK